MVRVSSIIVQDHRCAVNIFEDNVNSPIVVEITKSSAAARLRDGNCRADEIADISKCAVVLVQEYELALAVLGSHLERIHLRINVTVDDEQVRPAVVIQVNAARAPTQVWHSGDTNPGSIGHFGEVHVPVIAIERVVLAIKVGELDGKTSGAVLVARCHSHPCHFATIAANRRSRHETHICEMPTAIVAIKIVRGRIIGDEQVGPAIVIEITPEDTQTVVAGRVIHPGRLGDISKGAVSIVAMEAVSQTLHAPWPTLHRDATKMTGSTDTKLWQVLEVQLHITRNHEVHEAVAIVVGKSRTGRPEPVG